MAIRQTDTYVRDDCFVRDAKSTAYYNSITRQREYRDSVPNPKYRQIIRNGGNATTPLTAYRKTVTIEPGVTLATGTPSIGWGKITNTHMALNGPYNVLNYPYSFNANLRTQAVAKATSQTYKAVADYQSSFQAGVFTGELKETIMLLRSPFERSAKLTDELLRSLSRDKSRDKYVKGIKYGNYTPLSKAAADSWLEFQYGILPLISDIRTINTLVQTMASKHEHTSVRGYGKSETSTNSVSDIGENGIAFKLEQSTVERCENIIRAGLSAEFLDKFQKVDNPYLTSFTDALSVPVTAWELIPYSFLLDYFVNIGDLIQSAVISRRSLSYISNSVISTVEVKKISRCTMVPNEPTRIKSIDSSTPKIVTEKLRVVTRDGTLLAIPPIVFSIPGSKVRYANITALLASRLL